jgi:hypothetical protein
LPVLLVGGKDVTRCLLKYLTPREQRILLNTSSLLADVKKNVLYWKLTNVQSSIFYARPSFWSLLKTLVHYPSQQLSLRIEGDYDDMSALGGVHTLDLEGGVRITDVSNLGGVHTLTLKNCNRITNVSGFGGIHTMSLYKCPGIRNVSALGNVHTLTLTFCREITDVNALGGVMELWYVEPTTGVVRE